MYPEGYGVRERGAPPGAQCVINREEFLQQNQSRAPVQQCVVGRPDQLMVVFGERQQREAKERRRGKFKAEAAVYLEKRL